MSVYVAQKRYEEGGSLIIGAFTTFKEAVDAVYAFISDYKVYQGDEITISSWDGMVKKDILARWNYLRREL